MEVRLPMTESYSCYCAFCSGPLSRGWVTFGSTDPEWLTERRRRLALNKRRLAGEDVHIKEDEHVADEDAKDGIADGEDELETSASKDALVNGGKINLETDPIHALLTAMELNESDSAQRGEEEDNAVELGEDGDINEIGEASSYDPIMLKRKDVSWVNWPQVLGYNGWKRKAFISGRGLYYDYGVFIVRFPPTDPNDLEKWQYGCYRANNTDFRPAFPFHRACMNVLAKRLGLERQENIDLDVLHEVCFQNGKRRANTLALDYGIVNGAGQSWQSDSGEEYIVSDPSFRPRVREFLRDLLPRRFLAGKTSSLNLDHRVLNDPLRALPYEIIHLILGELSLEDIQSLMQSSWYVYASTCNNAFWKQKLVTSVLPWLWEASFLLEDESLSEVLNWKDIFLWLSSATKPQFGVDGLFMGVANRRRIWNACQPLVDQYLERVYPEQRPEPDVSEIRTIKDSAKASNTALVMYPVPETVHPVSSQFICSWDELHNRSSVLCAWWNQKGALVGISVTFVGSDTRVFGSTEGVRGTPLYIPKGNWIREFVVHIEEIDMFNIGQDRSDIRDASENVPRKTVHIVALGVVLADGYKEVERNAPRKKINQRSFAALAGHHIIGLTGQASESGEISHLGLLQVPDPEADPTLLPGYLGEDQMLLWNPRYEQVINRFRAGFGIHPSKRDFSIVRLGEEEGPNSELRSLNTIPPDMVPWQLCPWGPDPQLKRISCFQPTGEAPCTESYIAGFGAGDMEGPPWAVAGTDGPVPVQDRHWQTLTDPAKELASWITQTPNHAFDPSTMPTFEIDGPGGEFITEVHASRDMEAVKLFTNKSRSCYFGVENKQDWLEYKAGEGRLVVGLACGFGRLAGWSSSAKMYSHWALSGLGVMNISREYLNGILGL